LCSAPHEAAPSFAILKLTHVFRLARAEQHSPTLAITEPRLISGQPCNGRADVGRQPPTSNYELLDQAGIAGSPPGHTQTRTGVVSLIDRRTSQDHFSGLMRSGHNGPLGKSAVSAPARAKGARVPLRGDSSRWSGRKLVSRPATEAPKNPLVRKIAIQGNFVAHASNPTSNFPRKQLSAIQTTSPVRQRPTPFPVGVTFAKWFQLWGATNTWHGRWPRGP